VNVKQKIINTMSLAPSKIFCGFRALGFTSNHVPLVTRYHKRHKDNYVVTCVGQAFHVYNTNKLGIVSVSDDHPSDINVMAADERFVYTAAGNQVFRVSRDKQIDKKFIGHNAEVTLLLPFGPHLISIDVDGIVMVWEIKTTELYMQTKFNPESFAITAIAHPHTYVNKMIFGSKQGKLQLWNIRTNKLVYSFTGWSSPVTTIVQSTAVDVMAIGLADGRIIMHNLALDKTVIKFKQDYGPVTNISFRTDGHPMMVSGSVSGHIAIWDLEKRKLHSYLNEAHSASVTGLSCLPSEPLMVTSAADNSLKVWIFDLADGGARLLRIREGHSATPTLVRFYGSDGQNILSAGLDSTIRSFSTVHDKHNKNLGRASFHKKASKKLGLKLDKYKMPPVIKFASESCRESDWDNLVACHRQQPVVSTWSYQRSTMGKHMLIHPRFSTDVSEHSITATAVDITSCGNFTVIGYSSGHIDMYNLQSGLFRGSFGDPTAHDCTVCGLVCDGLNQKVISGGSDGSLCFWRFKAKTKIEKIQMESYIRQMVLHRDSSMLAISLDNFSIHIVDIDTRRVVRKFTGHSSAVTDMTFRMDGRWLISASMDCTIRTWNLPIGRLIDAFLLDSAPTSVTMSPCNNFLATTHVGDMGVYLWSNRTLYTQVSLGPLPDDFTPRMADLPSTVPSDLERTDFLEDDETEDDAPYKSPQQLGDELVTLSLLPSSRWLNLLNLDVIKMRNKPKEPPKKPKSAPFFLPTVAGLETKFDFSKENQDSTPTSQVKKPELGALTDFAMLLTKAHQSANYDQVLNELKGMGPSAIDKELRSLAEGEGGSDQVMAYFLEFVEFVLKGNKDFELVHSYLALFLKLHGDDVSGKAELSEKLMNVSNCQFDSWSRVRELMQRTLGMVTYLRSATL